MRALIVGLGRMGTFHARVLRDLGCDVTTVDPDRSRRADCLSTPVGYFHVVCVAVPIRHVAECAAGWAGHSGRLLIEKPMARTVAEARELERALRGQHVAVGYVERFNPVVRTVRALEPSSAHFIRWNERPTDDVTLDLASHDIDLARYLRLADATFDARGGMPYTRRTVTVGNRVVDLMAHDTSPLHAQWHTYLSGREGPATMTDAIAVLERLAEEVDDGVESTPLSPYRRAA